VLLSFSINIRLIYGVFCNAIAARIFHVSTTLLEKIDEVQRSFVHKLGLTQQQAFLDFNFAPSCLRRNIAVLDLLHKRVLGQYHPTFERLLPCADRFDGFRDFAHSKQLYGHRLEVTHHRSLFGKCIFKMVDI